MKNASNQMQFAAISEMKECRKRIRFQSKSNSSLATLKQCQRECRLESTWGWLI